MLTGALVRVRFSKDLIVPRYIESNNRQALAEGATLLETFHRNIGRTRGELEQDLIDVFGYEPGQFGRRGLIKLLDDRCEWAQESKCPPAEIRDAIFTSAFAARRISAFDREAIMNDVAGRLQLSAEEISDGMFADLKSEQRLKQIDPLTPERLLLRYNVALVQSILLKADQVVVEVRRETPAQLRRLIRLVKFHRLVCELTQPMPEVVRMVLDGPLSMFTATQKYGLQLAMFFPAVLACRDYTVEAQLRWGANKSRKRLIVSPIDGLVSHRAETGTFVPAEVSMFASLFRKKISDWELMEENDVFPLGDSFWVPDFRLVHCKTRKVIGLEILGFWRKGAAVKQLDRLRKFATIPYLVAVSNSLRIDEAELDEMPNVIQFKQLPLPEAVADAASEVVRQSENMA
jgi:predicted nuclease of restriction endonuclease-like RecB superfamily